MRCHLESSNHAPRETRILVPPMVHEWLDITKLTSKGERQGAPESYKYSPDPAHSSSHHHTASGSLINTLEQFFQL